MTVGRLELWNTAHIHPQCSSPGAVVIQLQGLGLHSLIESVKLVSLLFLMNSTFSYYSQLSTHPCWPFPRTHTWEHTVQLQVFLSVSLLSIQQPGAYCTYPASHSQQHIVSLCVCDCDLIAGSWGWPFPVFIFLSLAVHGGER